MMACKRRSDNLSLVKYGHSEIIRAESHTPKHDTCPGGGDRQRKDRHTCSLTPSVPMSSVQVHVAGVAGLPAACSRRLCAETDVLPWGRCARSERRSVSERSATMSRSGNRSTHSVTQKDTGMPIEACRKTEKCRHVAHAQLAGPLHG
jgi:hypothetical protein